MSTTTLRPLRVHSEERGDLDPYRKRWAGEGGSPVLLARPYAQRVGLNRWGRPTQATAPDNGAGGWVHNGLLDVYGDASVSACVTAVTSEGAHERSAVWLFQVPLARAAVVSSAILSFASSVRLYNNAIILPSKGGRNVWAWKMYGVAEDNAAPARQIWGRGWITAIQAEAGDSPVFGSSYEVSYGSEWCRHLPYNGFATHQHPPYCGMNGRHYRADSWWYMREHTTAVVAWEWPYDGGAQGAVQGTAPVPPPNTSMLQFGSSPGGAAWSSPDLAAVVNEILSRSGWSAGNRLAIMLSPDGLWDDQAAGVPPFDPVGYKGDGPGQLGWQTFTAPTLVLTY